MKSPFLLGYFLINGCGYQVHTEAVTACVGSLKRENRAKGRGTRARVGQLGRGLEVRVGVSVATCIIAKYDTSKTEINKKKKKESRLYYGQFFLCYNSAL